MIERTTNTGTGRHIIKGNKALAEHLGVSVRTVATWRKKGVLKKATLSDFCRTIIYDVEMVYKVLNYSPRCKKYQP